MPRLPAEYRIHKNVGESMNNATEEQIINDPIDDIEFLEYRVESRKVEIELLEKIISDKKDKMFMVVESEYEDDKKNAALSNADKRKIEVKRRLSEDQCYVKADDGLFDLRDLQMVEEVRLHAMKRKFIKEFCQVNLPI